LRHRLIRNGRSVEFDGLVTGTIGANAQAQLGTLAPGFRSIQSRLLVGSVIGASLSYGFAQIQVNNAGEVYIRPSSEMQQASITVIWALD